jgi:hypothetical protein
MVIGKKMSKSFHKSFEVKDKKMVRSKLFSAPTIVSFVWDQRLILFFFIFFAFFPQKKLKLTLQKRKIKDFILRAAKAAAEKKPTEKWETINEDI